MEHFLIEDETYAVAWNTPVDIFNFIAHLNIIEDVCLHFEAALCFKRTLRCGGLMVCSTTGVTVYHQSPSKLCVLRRRENMDLHLNLGFILWKKTRLRIKRRMKDQGWSWENRCLDTCVCVSVCETQKTGGGGGISSSVVDAWNQSMRMMLPLASDVRWGKWQDVTGAVHHPCSHLRPLPHHA